MKYAFELELVAMIYVSTFIKIGSGIRKLVGGGYTGTQDTWRSHKPTLGKGAKIINLNDRRHAFITET
jgi:hypothetical protein